MPPVTKKVTAAEKLKEKTRLLKHENLTKYSQYIPNTTGIINIIGQSEATYKTLLEECFDNVDIRETVVKKEEGHVPILQTIAKLDAATSGTFMDIVIRRLICEITGTQFQTIKGYPDYDTTMDKLRCMETPSEDLMHELLLLADLHNAKMSDSTLIESKYIKAVLDVDGSGFIADYRNYLKSLILPEDNVVIGPTTGGSVTGTPYTVKIKGDADFIHGTCLYEIKCVKDHKLEKAHLMQLFMYAAMMRRRTSECSYSKQVIDEFAIINPRLGTIARYSLLGITDDMLLKYLLHTRNLYCNKQKKKWDLL